MVQPLAVRNCWRSPARLSEKAQQRIQERGNLRKRGTAVEQTGNGAEQVAQQIARSGDGDDIQDHLVEVYGQPQEIEIERAQHQVQDVARDGRYGNGVGGAWSRPGDSPASPPVS